MHHNWDDDGRKRICLLRTENHGILAKVQETKTYFIQEKYPKAGESLQTVWDAWHWVRNAFADYTHRWDYLGIVFQNSSPSHHFLDVCDGELLEFYLHFAVVSTSHAKKLDRLLISAVAHQ